MYHNFVKCSGSAIELNLRSCFYIEKCYISLSWTLILQNLYKTIVTVVPVFNERMLQKVLAVWVTSEGRAGPWCSLRSPEWWKARLAAFLPPALALTALVAITCNKQSLDWPPAAALLYSVADLWFKHCQHVARLFVLTTPVRRAGRGKETHAQILPSTPNWPSATCTLMEFV